MYSIFRNSPYRFTIDQSSNVFVYSKEFTLQATLSRDFFSSNKQAPIPPDMDSAGPVEPSNIVGLKTTVENMLIEIGNRSASGQGKAVLTGYVKDINSGEPITGASVFVDTLSVGTISDQFGY